MKHLAGQYFLNSDLRPEEIREQVREFSHAGYEIIYLHARAGLKTPYLSKHWFSALQIAIDELIAHNIEFAIWDEDNYPSGDAGNRICNSYPELAASYLNFHIIEAKKDVPVLEYFSENGAFSGCWAVDDSGTLSDISDCCGTLSSKWGRATIQTTSYSPYGQLPYPHRRRGMDTPRYALAWTPDRDCRIVCVETLRRTPGRHSSDLLNPLTTQKFLELVHEDYEKHFADQMQHCFGSFMDEPSPSGYFPWTREFPAEFERDHGYDLSALLPHLTLDIADISPKIRNDYRKTLGRLLCQNYLIPVKNWLNKRHIFSTGHLSRSEHLAVSGLLWPNELRCLKNLDIPCCDPLGAGVGRPESIAHHIGIKTVSSAAHWFGKAAAGADAFAVGGDTVSLCDLKFLLNYHLVMGITWFNIHGLYYTLDGERRDEAPPSLFYQHAQWPHMKFFLDYLKKRCEELSGEHICNLVMLYPSAALQSRLPESAALDEALHRTAERLVSNQRDFELIDEVTLLEQDPEKFAVQYPYFLVAHTPQIERSCADWLEKYAAAGGTIFAEGVTPDILPENITSPVVKWAFADHCRTDDYIRQIPSPAAEGDGSQNILLRKIRKEGRERLFLFNRGSGIFNGKVDGTAIQLAPGEAAFFDELQAGEKLPELTADNWSLQFDLNSVPLNWWQAENGPRLNLLEKHTIDDTFFTSSMTFSAIFSVEDKETQLLFTTEEATLERGTFEVNGVPLNNFHKAVFRDCREIECDITPLLKSGRNTIKFNGRLFENPPFLRGRFQVSFPLGNCGCPELSAAPEKFELAALSGYNALGYGTFSGKACYEGKLNVPAAGRYTLPLPLKNDSVQVFIDNAACAGVIAPPYQIEVELSAGEHAIRLEICNAPGNRDVMAGIPAGLQV